MRNVNRPWTRLLVGCTFLCSTVYVSCAGVVYELSDRLGAFGDRLTGEDDDANWWDDVINEMEDWF